MTIIPFKNYWRCLNINKYRLFHGDCLEVLRTLPENSVDSVCCDPPYGLSREPDITEVLTKWLAGEEYDHGHGGFMGKSWDSFVPHPDIWREVYRVLKPGGHALVFAGTRTQDLMTISLRLAGFEVRDVIEWLYFSGMPKSHNVSKAFDRRRKEDEPAVRNVCRFIRRAMDEQGFVSRDLTQYFNDCNPRLIDHWAARDTDSQPSMPKIEQYEKLKEVLRLSNEMDAEVWRLNGRKGQPGDAWEQREKVGEFEYKRKGEGTWDEQSPGGMFGSQERTIDITAPATELARKWDGWGTALKPAHEPIIVVRKPLIDADTGRKLTVVDCVEKYGTGAINVDASRIGKIERKISDWNYNVDGADNSEIDGVFSRPRVSYTPHEAGRFPANCITLDSDAFYSKYFNVGQANISPEELSKKASKRDRNSDWQGEEITLDEAPTGHGNLQNSGGFERFNTVNRNNHPTVKPTDLMAWLVRLVTPPNGIVLDPFAGSGSTLVAARREGFGFIGIEREAEYVEIIEARTDISAEPSVIPEVA